ncbi:hypothetical protein MTR67_043018 [Solanum verrucosum]|nr:hypothetical protein MTR67_043018 [Solanum verrucosum]
MGINHSY